MDFFLKFDVFTINSFFQLESKSKVASFPGLFFSIIVYIFLLYNFLTSDMVKKTNPKTSDVIISNSLLDNFELSSKDFGISITDYNDNFVQYFDPQIWRMVFYSKHYSLGTKTQFFLVNCTSQEDEGRLCRFCSRS